MVPLVILEGFEQGEENDDAGPDGEKRKKRGRAVFRNYKEIKQGMQCDGKDKSEDDEYPGQPVLSNARVPPVGERKREADGGGREHVEQGRADEPQVFGKEAPCNVARAEGSDKKERVLKRGKSER